MRKFILIAIVVIAGAFVIFNFWAAHVAENRIDNTIQTQADSSVYSAQYSSINVRPFAGNIYFDNLTVIGKSNIGRAEKAVVDLRYIDFLDIYFGGFKYGLKNVLSGNIDFKKFSVINRQSTQQVSFKVLQIAYTGQFWDGVRHLVAKQPLRHAQKITARGRVFSFRKATAKLGHFKSDSVYARLQWAKARASTGTNTDSVKFTNTIWTPAADFQQKYAFFIKGFGFRKDSIAIPAAGFSSSYRQARHFKIRDGQLKTKLFSIHFHGTVLRDSSWSKARLAPMNISITNFSPRFKDVLTNMQQLMGKNVPQLEDSIHLRLAGPLNSPHVVRPDTANIF